MLWCVLYKVLWSSVRYKSIYPRSKGNFIYFCKQLSLICRYRWRETKYVIIICEDVPCMQFYVTVSVCLSSWCSILSRSLIEQNQFMISIIVSTLRVLLTVMYILLDVMSKVNGWFIRMLMILVSTTIHQMFLQIYISSVSSQLKMKHLS
jgi:hypothetical protein